MPDEGKTMKFTFRDEKSHLFFQCTGTFDFEGLSALVERIRVEARTPGTRIVVDFRAVGGVFDTLTRYRIGELAGEKLKGHRILSLARQEAINHLSENTAVNRGAMVHTTPDEKEGMDWLMRESV
jgi:hypothetical protein